MKVIQFKKEETDWLIENYPKFGAVYCGNYLGRDVCSIHNKAKRLKIKVAYHIREELRFKKKYIEIEKNLPMRLIGPDFTPEICYILGFIWADGYVSNKNGITIAIHNKDIGIENYLIKFGFRKYFFKNQVIFKLFYRPLIKKMMELNFFEKYKKSPDIILDCIPENMRRYFILGFFDGDGCIYHNKKSNNFTVSFTGQEEQNWEFLEKFLKSLNIKYGITKRYCPSKTGVYANSWVYISNLDGVRKALDFIYSDTDLGLSRKREKYKTFLSLEKIRRGRKTNA